MVTIIKEINYQEPRKSTDSYIFRADYNLSPAIEVLRRFDIEGVVDEIRGEHTKVIFDNKGKDEPRTMSTSYLQSRGIKHEDQSFRLHIVEGQKQGDAPRVRAWASPISPTEEGPIITEDLWPDLDTTKFKILN